MSKLKTKVEQQEQLSDYPSEAILQTVEDIEWVEKTEGFKVNMYHWLNVDYKGSCSVCMAGATSMRRYKFEGEGDQDRLGRELGSAFTGFDEEGSRLLTRQLRSLNDLRSGFFFPFLAEWIVSRPEATRISELLRETLKYWVTYDRDPGKFKKNMRIVSSILASEGY